MDLRGRGDLAWARGASPRTRGGLPTAMARLGNRN